MHPEEPFFRTIFEHLHQAGPRLVFADWLEERGDKRAKAIRACPDWPMIEITNERENGGGGDGYGGGGYGGGGYGGDDDGGGGYGGDGYGGDGYGGDGYGGDGYGGGLPKLREVIAMESGFYVLSIRSSYNPYIIVGHVEVNGFELTCKNCRIIRRFGGNRSISELASKGPIQSTELLAPSEVEYVFRPNVARAIPANEKVWAKHFEKG